MKKIIKVFFALFYKLKYFRRCEICILSNTIYGKCDFEGKNAIWQNTHFVNSSLGYGSYVGKGGEFYNCKIGRFCSIAANVRVISASHPTRGTISTHPAFYSNNPYFQNLFHYNVSLKYEEHIKTANGYDCEIGNDVWIGENVLIKGGITIGDGAVIGMGSIVTHDITPYTIVAGVPAKQIRMRFDDITIQKLMQIKWWDKPLEWIAAHAFEFNSPNEFVNKYGTQEE